VTSDSFPEGFTKWLHLHTTDSTGEHKTLKLHPKQKDKLTYGERCDRAVKLQFCKRASKLHQQQTQKYCPHKMATAWMTWMTGDGLSYIYLLHELSAATPGPKLTGAWLTSHNFWPRHRFWKRNSTICPLGWICANFTDHMWHGTRHRLLMCFNPPAEVTICHLCDTKHS
jgi:hypothetical protein